MHYFSLDWRGGHLPATHACSTHWPPTTEKVQAYRVNLQHGGVWWWVAVSTTGFVVVGIWLSAAFTGREPLHVEWQLAVATGCGVQGSPFCLTVCRMRQLNT